MPMTSLDDYSDDELIQEVSRRERIKVLKEKEKQEKFKNDMQNFLIKYDTFKNYQIMQIQEECLPPYSKTDKSRIIRIILDINE